MYQSTEDITDLAESIGLKYCRGKVNLIKIARDNSISILKRSYNYPFPGMLVYQYDKFYIVLNTNEIQSSELGRVRFTIAHELGHYFIDEQRNKLTQGIELSVEEEKAADHFAAFLLMPRSLFVEIAQKSEPGLLSILKIKKKFGTSIVSTTRHYIEMDLCSCMMIRWDHEMNFKYLYISQKLTLSTGLNRSNVKLLFQKGYLKYVSEFIQTENIDYHESATYLSRWTILDIEEKKNDLLGIEQTITIGTYGGITLLLF